MTITALETAYAGCRFRSRLEARWAVFFDRLGIRWQYEPQGFSVNGRPYLPDFHLTDLDLWVEVKGSDEQIDPSLVIQAAVRHYGLPSDLLILGPIPRPGGRPAHSVLQFHKGDVYRRWLEFSPAGLAHITCDWRAEPIGNDSGDATYPSPGLVPAAYLSGSNHKSVHEAYRAARSARFEHGERG